MALNIKPLFPFDHPDAFMGSSLQEFEICTSGKSSSSSVSNKNSGAETSLSRYQKQKSLYNFNLQPEKELQDDLEDDITIRTLRSLDII